MVNFKSLRPGLGGLACFAFALSAGCGRVYDDFALPEAAGGHGGHAGSGEGGDGALAGSNDGGSMNVSGGTSEGGSGPGAIGGSGPGAIGGSGPGAIGGSDPMGAGGEGGAGGELGAGPALSLDEAALSTLTFWGFLDGGDPFSAVGCDVGEVAVGLHVWTSQPSGVVPVAIGLRCAVLSSTGELGPTHYAPLIAGGRQSDANAFEDCPSGSVAVGSHGYVYNVSHAAPFITTIGLECAPLRAWVVNHDKPTPGQSFGSSSGSPFTDDCAQGWVLRSFSGRKYDFFDGLQAHCVKVLEGP